MKKLFFTIVALMAATMSFAQNTLVATLSHGTEVTMYYGAWALRNAMDAAVSGDIINLSGGGFDATNITKAVTLRGAGIDGILPTYILGGFTINIDSEDANRLTMEGICFSETVSMQGSFSNPIFLKSQFTNISYADNSNIQNTMFVNCKIFGNNLYLNGTSSAQFLNCYVEGFRVWWYNETTSAVFVNCVIRPYVEGTAVHLGALGNSHVINSIIYEPGQLYYGDTYHLIRESTTCTNCVNIGYPTAYDRNPASTNCKVLSYAEVFKNFTGSYSDDQTFELTDEAKTTLLGTDGTQIGLYGGVMPYNTTVSYPQITKMNVANKTTADGKLSVDIEVSAAQ